MPNHSPNLVTLGDVYDDPERTIIASEIMHAIIGHRSAGRPLTLEAGIVRVADALDMEHGRSRTSLETHLANIHSLSAAAIDEVRLVEGETRPIRIEIEMNNSAGVFQVDSLLGSKLRGSGLEEHIEVVAASEDEASILGTDPGAPLLSITRTAQDAHGEVFEFSHDLFRADRTIISVRTPATPRTSRRTVAVKERRP